LKHVRVEKNNCKRHITEFRYELMHRPNTTCSTNGNDTFDIFEENFSKCDKMEEKRILDLRSIFQ